MAGEQYSEKQLLSLLNSWQGSAAELLEMIAAAVGEFAHGAEQHDDITMLASYRERV
jgi:serine phosphatase RsbU (regulator of sigma subunit)